MRMTNRSAILLCAFCSTSSVRFYSYFFCEEEVTLKTNMTHWRSITFGINGTSEESF